jgi:PAS domain S-box-containing protein
MKIARILVVEDDSIISMDIQNTLQKLGHELAGTAVLGEEAVEKASDLRPELVLMDIELAGELDGVEAAAHIRERLQIPVIFLTAYSEDTTLQRAKTTEPYGYLVKPLVERDLRIGIEMALHKHQAERRMAERERWFTDTLTSIGEAVIATDPQGQVRFMNSLAESITGWRRDEAIAQHLDNVLVLSEKGAPGHGSSPFAEAAREGFAVDWSSNTYVWPREGPLTPIDYAATRIRHENGETVGVVIVFRDISPRKLMEQEREGLISELQNALAKVKTLSGMLPICASCKKIRDDKGYWEAVEGYLRKHSDVTFTHGLCPGCIRKLYPDFADEILASLPPSESGTLNGEAVGR